MDVNNGCKQQWSIILITTTLCNQKQELPVVAMFVNGSGRNEQSLYRIFHRCFLPSVGSFGQAVAEKKIGKVR